MVGGEELLQSALEIPTASTINTSLKVIDWLLRCTRKQEYKRKDPYAALEPVYQKLNCLNLASFLLTFFPQESVSSLMH